MPRTSTSPRFTEANKLFIYRLLRDQLGCGKQTFITRVDEVLAQDRLTAEDLGFDSTLQLLEALGADVVKITLFKGGRAYATVLPREDWDKALATPESKAPAKGNKPWKKKKGDKSIKPSCPKRVKREEAPADSPTAKMDDDATVNSPNRTDATAGGDAATSDASASTPDAATPNATPSNAATSNSVPGAPQAVAARDPRLRNANFSLEGIDADEADSSKDEGEANDAAAETNVAESEGAPVADNALEAAEERAADSPRITLTVTYDPYTGQEGESSLVATPEELAKRAAEKAAAEAARRAAQEATAAAARAAQIARERRAAVIAAAIAERAAQKEAEAARELAEAETRARAEAEADMAAMKDADRQDAAALSDAAVEPVACDTPADEIAHQQAVADSPRADEAAAEENASLPTPPLAPQEEAGPAATAVAEPVEPSADSSSTPAPAPAPEPVSAASALPSDFPLDFSSEVFCPGPLLHALTMLYPYGADVMGIVSEYCLIARERGSIEASRSKATFAICYLQNGQRASADVVIRRRREAGMGAAWAIDSVTVAEIDDAE